MKIYFKTEGEMKPYSDKQELREFIISRSTIQKILKGIFCRKVTPDGSSEMQREMSKK